MSDKMTCPVCESHTSAILRAVNESEPCPVCGAPAALIVQINTLRDQRVSASLLQQLADLTMNRPSLTDAEMGVLANLDTVARLFFALPEHHPSERAEFVTDLHHLQERIMARVAIRAHPQVFTAMAPTDPSDLPTSYRWLGGTR